MCWILGFLYGWVISLGCSVILGDVFILFGGMGLEFFVGCNFYLFLVLFRCRCFYLFIL